MLTRKQYELLRFISERLKESGVPPSFDEMKDALDLRSKSGIHRLITALEERGFIRRLPNRARALEVLRVPEAKTATAGARPSAPVTVPQAANDVVELPLHGRIAAGMPIEAHVLTGERGELHRVASDASGGPGHEHPPGKDEPAQLQRPQRRQAGRRHRRGCLGGPLDRQTKVHRRPLCW